MFIVELWKNRYYLRSNGTTRPPKTTTDIKRAKQFWHRDAIPIDYGKIIDIGESSCADAE